MKEQNIRVRLIILNEKKVLIMHDSDVGYSYYPGGHVEWGETIKETAERECKEECDDEFIFEKILYIRDFLDHKRNVHSLELFVLGKLKNSRADNSKDPSGKKSQSLEWIDIDKLPDNLYPRTFAKKLPEDFKNNFPNQGEYLGVIK